MIAESIVFLFGLLLFIGCMQAVEVQRDLIVVPKEIIPCHPDLVEPWELNVTMRRDPVTTQTTISGEWTMRVPYTDKFHVHVEIRKCLSVEESSCHHFLILDDDSFCRDLKKPDKWWYQMQSHVENVSFTCPIAPGTYKVDEIPITKILTDHGALMPGIWRMESSVRDGERTLGCVLGYGEIKPIRRARKKPSKGPGVF